jgi:heme exporter protein D
MSTHGGYILAAYSSTFVVIAVLALWLITQRRTAKNNLAALEAAGIKRRSDL